MLLLFIFSFLLGLYRLLSRRDSEVMVENGQPFLFKNGEDSVRRMRSFLGNRQTNVSVRIFLSLYCS